MKLEGRTALVTGAGRKIGRATALALAAEGANVVVNVRANRDEAEAVAAAVEAAGARGLPVVADIGERTQIDTLMARALETFGRVDILVNNAAIRPRMPVLDAGYEDLRRVMAVNFEAAFLLIQAAVPGMVAQGWGRIIQNVGLNSYSGQAERAIVSASKMALVGLTRSLAQELGGKGILVNCVGPGMIDAGPTAQGRLARIPLGRKGEPEEIAAATVFLASDDASFINGQLIHVNGGEHCF